MPVVSNTSPITNLAIIGRLELLRTRFEKLWIPGAVESELRQLPNPAALAAIEDAFRGGWIAVRRAPDNATTRLLTAKLDPGEAEAIAGRGHVGGVGSTGRNRRTQRGITDRPASHRHSGHTAARRATRRNRVFEAGVGCAPNARPVFHWQPVWNKEVLRLSGESA